VNICEKKLHVHSQLSTTVPASTVTGSGLHFQRKTVTCSDTTWFCLWFCSAWYPDL